MLKVKGFVNAWNQASDQPRAVIGMFDVSARPYAERERLTFAVPMNKFAQMIGNMEEGFLIICQDGNAQQLMTSSIVRQIFAISADFEPT